MASFRGIRSTWRAQPRAVRELCIFVIALLVGVFVMPFAIHAVGSETLGEYTHGGATELQQDFVRALGRGARAFWAVALGPYVFLMIGRLLVRTVRGGNPVEREPDVN